MTTAPKTQDADSFGWRIFALFVSNASSPRWGTLDLLCRTDHGSDVSQRVDLAPTIGLGLKEEIPEGLRTPEAVVRDFWYLIDWHPSEEGARRAFGEARSRSW